MIALLFFLSSQSTIRFSVDPVVFRSTVTVHDTIAKTTTTADLTYIEFNCNIPYNELSYEAIDSIIFTRAMFVFELINVTVPDTFVDTLYRQFSIPSFAQAAQQQMSFAVQRDIYVPEGTFEYRITVTSGTKVGAQVDTIVIDKAHYRISDLLLASTIERDTTGSYLTKGNLRVVPHPSHEFNERYPTLFIYYEIYDVIPDTSKLNITYKIVDANGKVMRQVSQAIDKQYVSQTVNWGIDIKAFDSGNYILSVDVRDPTQQTSAYKELAFRIQKQIRQEVSYEGLPYYEEIEYFISPAEYKKFLSFSDEGKRNYLQRFWSIRDYYATADRFRYADEHYRAGDTRGSKTDRGRIYAKYGEPDDSDISTFKTQESRPYEHWQYENGLAFIFVDIRSTNEFTLVWTNARDESSKPSLYKYLPSELLDELE